MIKENSLKIALHEWASLYPIVSYRWILISTSFHHLCNRKKITPFTADYGACRASVQSFAYRAVAPPPNLFPIKVTRVQRKHAIMHLVFIALRIFFNWIQKIRSIDNATSQKIWMSLMALCFSYAAHLITAVVTLTV